VEGADGRNGIPVKRIYKNDSLFSCLLLLYLELLCVCVCVCVLMATNNGNTMPIR
jgi:hypothetical protein